MIKTKDNIKEILSSSEKFTYDKEGTDIDVFLHEDNGIKMMCDSKSKISIYYYSYDEGLSLLYKDRKYINKALFQ